MGRHRLSAIVSDYRRDKLREELASEWAVALVYRPLALVVSWVLSGTAVRPNQITLAGLALLPAMMAAAWFLSGFASLAVIAGLAVAFLVADCVDGTIARLKGAESRLGRYLDASADLLFRAVAYGSFGLAMQRAGVAGIAAFGPFALALIAAWLALFARTCREYSNTRFALPATARARPWNWPDYLTAALSGIDSLFPFLALAAWLAGWPQAFIWWILIFSLLDLFATQRAILAGLRP